LAANFDDQTIIDTLNQLGIYNQDTPVVTTPEVTTPEVVNAQPNIINQLSTGRTNNIGSLNVDSFYDATTARQDRLQNPSPFTQKINNIVGKFLPIPRSVPKTLGIGGLLANILPDKYYDQTLGQQAFTQSQMGYTGPTVFGENPTGNYKDPFGYNVRSAFGNYSDFVQERLGKLENIVEDQLSRGLKNTLQMKELAFRQKQNIDRQNIISDAAKIQELKRQEEIKAAAAREIANQAAITSTRNAFTDRGNSVGRSSDPGTAAAGMGGGSRQATSAGSTSSGRTDGGWGWAKGGRVGYQTGGVATPETYAKALQQVGAGSALDKLRSTGDYIKNYVSNVGQSVLDKNAAIKGIASFYGIGKPISSFSDFSSGSQQAIKDAVMRTVQNPTLNQYSKTNIPMSSYTNYFSDKGKANTRGIYDTGYLSRPDQFKDMISALGGNEDAIARMTLGRFNVDIDPTSGVGYLRDKYDFSKQMPGGKAYDINMQLPQDFVQQILNNPTYQKTTGYTPPTTQTTSSIPQFYQNNPGSYDFDKFKEAYAFATGQQNLVSRNPDGQIVTNFGNWDPSNTYGAYMSDTGTSNSNPFFSQFRDPNTFNKNTLISMYGAPGAGKAYYADGGLATMFSEKR
jgi:hypothetical protein